MVAPTLDPGEQHRIPVGNHNDIMESEPLGDRVTLEVEDGRAVAVKRSRNVADATRLRREAAVLEAARHPGVVELLRIDDDGQEVTLVTVAIGTRSLETVEIHAVGRVAGTLAAVADTLADLHEVGLVHGRVEPSHVLLGAGGRPVLCGFAGGGQVGTVAGSVALPPPEWRDPTVPSGTTLAPHQDVYGLGVLLRTMLGGGDSGEPIPDRRWAWLRRTGTWRGWQRRALLTLADQATDDEPTKRPTARRLARAIRDSVPEAVLTADDDPASRARDADPERTGTAGSLGPSARDVRRRVTTGVAAVIGLGLLVYGFGALRGGDGGTDVPTPPARVASAADATSSTPSAAGTGAAPSGAVCPPAEGERADVDGDGCAESVTLAPDGTIVAGAARFALGSPGDPIALGDWDCDGSVTPALLRVDTGDIFVFDGWAGPDEDLRAAAVATRPGASALEVGRDGAGPGCDVLFSVGLDGARSEVVA